MNACDLANRERNFIISTDQIKGKVQIWQHSVAGPTYVMTLEIGDFQRLIHILFLASSWAWSITFFPPISCELIEICL